jgi:hypothetical protein
MHLLSAIGTCPCHTFLSLGILDGIYAHTVFWTSGWLVAKGTRQIEHDVSVETGRLFTVE